MLEFFSALEEADFESYSYFQETLRPLLESDPFAVGPPIWEGLGDGLFEISWGRHRVYCSVENPRRILLYMGVKKFWRAFRKEHRRTCKRCRAEVLGPDYDQEARHYMYLELCKRRKQNGPSTA